MCVLKCPHRSTVLLVKTTAKPRIRLSQCVSSALTVCIVKRRIRLSQCAVPAMFSCPHCCATYLRFTWNFLCVSSSCVSSVSSSFKEFLHFIFCKPKENWVKFDKFLEAHQHHLPEGGLLPLEMHLLGIWLIIRLCIGLRQIQIYLEKYINCISVHWL